MSGRKNLTFFEAAALVAGLGVGGGIMAVPYLAAQNGLFKILAITLAAYAVSVLLHLMIVEMVQREGGQHQLVELFRRLVFTGRAGLAFTWVFFALLAGGITFLLAGYVVGCGEILAELLGLPLAVGEIAIYLVAAGVVFFGIKAVGLIEKYAIVALALVVLALALGSLGRPLQPLPVVSGAARAALAFYSMLMFGFGCWFAVPQAVEGLADRPRLVPWAVVTGITINLVFVLVITLMALLVSREVTPIAISGWGAAVGPWAFVLGSVCVFLAMLTSYWSFSYALAVIIQQRVGWKFPTAWLLATAPSLVLAVGGLTDFLGFLRLTGGLTAVIIAILAVPALRAVRREVDATAGGFSVGRWGDAAGQAVIVVAYALMAVGSLVSLD